MDKQQTQIDEVNSHSTLVSSFQKIAIGMNILN